MDAYDHFLRREARWGDEEAQRELYARSGAATGRLNTRTNYSHEAASADAVIQRHETEASELATARHGDASAQPDIIWCAHCEQADTTPLTIEADGFIFDENTEQVFCSDACRVMWEIDEAGRLPF